LPEDAARTDLPVFGLRRKSPWTPGCKNYVAAGLVIFVFVFGCSAWLSTARDLHEPHQYLGGEYYNIGRAIADGRGFSDPFAERTGPTAWMPPLLPTLIAGLLLVTGTRANTAVAVVLLNNLALVAVGLTVYGIARQCHRRMSPWVAVGFYLLWLAIFRYWTFELTHDVWLLMLGSNALALGAYWYTMGGRMTAWIWGATGGLLSLCSPALAFAWACLTSTFLLRATGDRRPWILALLLAMVIASPWTLRNALVFHRFIPVKSNLFFDAYLSNYEDPDGLLDAATLTRHPYVWPKSRLEYARLGEVDYTGEYRKLFLRTLKQDPATLFRKIGNRVLALFRYPIMDERKESKAELPIKRAIYALPFCVLLLSIWIRGPHQRLLRVLSGITLAYLLTYVLVSFSIRYLLPLTPIMILLFFLGIDQIAYRADGWRRRLPASLAQDASSTA
jgi:hypothetical protein